MQDFKMYGEQMNKLSSMLKDIKKELDDTYDELRAVKANIQLGEGWTGDSADGFLLYVDLLDQYHSHFAANGINDNCVKQAVDIFDKFDDIEQNFYDNYETYQKVRNIN